MKKHRFEHILCNKYKCELINNKGTLYFRRRGSNKKVRYNTSQVNDILDREAREILNELNFSQNDIDDILG